MIKVLLLLALDRVVVSVGIDGNQGWLGLNRGDEVVKEHVAKTEDSFGLDAVFKAREGKLSGEVLGIVGERPAIILKRGRDAEVRNRSDLRIIGENLEKPLADHRNEALSGEYRFTTVVECFGDLAGEADLFVKLADEDQAAIAGKGYVGDIDNHCFLDRKVKINGKAGCKFIGRSPDTS